MAQTKEQKAAYMKAYFSQRKEARAVYLKEYRAANKQRIKELYTKNRDRLLRLGAAWKLKNSEKVKKYSRADRARYKLCERGARKRGFSFDLTFLEYQAIITDACCNYCKGSLPETGHGLDRIDSQKGYTTDNVVPCCSTCNTMFGALKKEDAIAHMQRILDVRSQKLP